MSYVISQANSPLCCLLFAGVDGVKWKKPVIPGDTLVMEVEIKKWESFVALLVNYSTPKQVLAYSCIACCVFYI